jgi:formylglycine-generating enzyme required for sulfatase activity
MNKNKLETINVKLTDKTRRMGDSSTVARLATLLAMLVSLPATASETFVQAANSGNIELTMIVVDNGEFLMGSPDKERGRSKREGPQVEVAIPAPFAISKTEITVAQFAAFVAATGYRTEAEQKGTAEVFNLSDGLMFQKSGATWRDDFNGEQAGGDLPVIRVSWNDAQAFTRWLATDTGKPYRLLSESEFEYALRAGTTSPYWWGKGAPKDATENLAGSKERAAKLKWPVAFNGYTDRFWGPAPVASLAPNPFGLHDMSGNAAEWVADCYATLDKIPTNGSANEQKDCPMRVFRGAAWAYPPPLARSAYRNAAAAAHSSATIGFRVAVNLAQDSQTQAAQ